MSKCMLQYNIKVHLLKEGLSRPPKLRNFPILAVKFICSQVFDMLHNVTKKSHDHGYKIKRLFL